jgi:hypothetical protein
MLLPPLQYLCIYIALKNTGKRVRGERSAVLRNFLGFGEDFLRIS